MSGIVSRLVVTAMSEAELEAWFNFLRRALGKVGLSFYVAEFDTQGDSTSIIYGVDGPLSAFARGIPKVTEESHDFAKALAKEHGTLPERYITSILLPIVENCYVPETVLEEMWHEFVTQFGEPP